MRRLFSLLFLYLPFFLFAQVNIGNLGFSYSALLRDSTGKVQPLKPVRLRFTLLTGQTGTATTSPWIETQNVMTDTYGFLNVTMGNGTRTGGSAATFSAIDYSSANYWLLIEVFNANNSNYEPLTKQALQTVAYAKVAGALTRGGGVPAGTVMGYAGDLAHIPEGWLWCNGAELDNTNPRYEALFNAIRYSWGSSNRSNLFRIPSTRGLFLRGVSGGAGKDPDAALRTTLFAGGATGDSVGTFQADVLMQHDHTVTSAGSRTGSNAAPPGSAFFAASGDCCDYGARQMVTDANAALGGDARPRNVYVNYIIKL